MVILFGNLINKRTHYLKIKILDHKNDVYFFDFIHERDIYSLAKRTLDYVPYNFIVFDYSKGGIIALGVLQAITATPSKPIVRTLSLDPGLIRGFLDPCNFRIICQMFSTVDDVRALNVCLPVFAHRNAIFRSRARIALWWL